MNRTHAISLSIAAAFLAFLMTATGCFKQDDLSNVPGSPEDRVFIEAYVEFPGPHERWVGPPGYVMNVNAKEATKPWVGVTSLAAKPVLGDRRIASIPKGDPQAARAQIERLATALKEDDSSPEFKGCLSPVRVRLVRGDGTMVEREGCRGYNAWTKTASEFVGYFLNL